MGPSCTQCGTPRARKRSRPERSKTTLCRPCWYKSPKTYLRLRPYEALYNYLVKRGGWEVTISYEEFASIAGAGHACHYCGTQITWAEFDTNSRGCGWHLDRKDNSRGYSLDNVVPCCAVCNYTKSDTFSYEEFIEVAQITRRHRRPEPDVSPHIWLDWDEQGRGEYASPFD